MGCCTTIINHFQICLLVINAFLQKLGEQITISLYSLKCLVMLSPDKGLYYVFYVNETTREGMCTGHNILFRPQFEIQFKML